MLLRLLFLFLVCMSYSTIRGQSLAITDSLELIILGAEFKENDSILFEIHRKLSFYHPQPVKALIHAQEALEISNRQKHALNKARALERVGMAQRMIGNKVAAFKASFRALSIYDSLDLKKRQAALQLQIGEQLVEDENYNDAIVQMEKSTFLFKELFDNYRLALAYINLAEAHRLNGNIEEAIKLNRKSIALNKSLNNEIIEAYAKGNLGLCYKALNDAPSALENLDAAIIILMDLNDHYSVSVYKSERGDLLIGQGKLDEGEADLIKSLEMAKSEGLKKQTRDICALLSSHFSNKGQYNLALTYQKLFQVYQDSLVNVENVREVEQIKAGYELDKKKMQIEVINAKVVQKEKELLFTIISIALLAVLIVVTFIGYRNKKRSNRLLHQKNAVITEQITEKDLLHREIHHRVKNNLQLIGSIMGLQSRSAQNDQVSVAMSAGKLRVEAVGLIHQNLFTDEDKTDVDLKEYLTNLVGNLKATYNDQLARVELQSIDLQMDADKVIPIGLIVNEAVCNSVKYQGDHKPEIRITLSSENQLYTLEICDTNPEYTAEEKDNSTGFGTKLITTLARQLRAKLDVKYGDLGTRITLQL